MKKPVLWWHVAALIVLVSLLVDQVGEFIDRPHPILVLIHSAMFIGFCVMAQSERK